MFIDVVASQGIRQGFFMMFLIHQDDLTASPNFSITSSKVYETNGNETTLTPTLSYSP